MLEQCNARTLKEISGEGTWDQMVANSQTKERLKKANKIQGYYDFEM